MRINPDFTWEWIIKACKSASGEIHKSETLSGNVLFETLVKSRYQGILAVVPLLREHPQLGQFVPMMALMGLHWFPDEDCEVGLSFDGNQGKYLIWAKDSTTLEETIVPLEEAANTVYAYITKYRQD